jgi:hypothetical protein
MSKKRVLISVVFGAVALGVSFQNCSNVAFSPVNQAVLSSSGDLDRALPRTITEEALKTLQPTLAVRGMSCILCHAQIESNVITDFGYGTPNFMGGEVSFDQGSNWFNNLADAWQTAHINGTVFVPDVPVTRSAQNILGSGYVNQPLLKIADFMKTPYQSTYGQIATPYTTPDESVAEMVYHVTPLPGEERVVARSHIKIRAPSENEIKALAPSLWAAGADMAGAIRVGASASAQVLQLFRQGAAGATYMQNDENVVLECSKSDIVVRGSLFLRRLKVNAAGGCRLYVTGTVFIEEGITYASGDLQNLQITSASGIMMGLDVPTLINRLLNDNRGLQLEGRDFKTLANQILSEANNIGTLKDGVNAYPPPGATFTYTGLLLNAPIVHSRYLGEMRGTIISEAILFRLSHLVFHFDSVFTKVNVLPLLDQSVLTVQ